ncbi:MAG: nucleoside triphosphate pyrophosphohydrolase [Planctomycetes bacterium]|nr:nucleoside triphosphate pyrophosphohydrolase [Planctomycetota bacterium]
MKSFAEFVDVMKRLRAPGGCPWDMEQTHESIKSCLIEEAYEVIDAINSGDSDALQEELGDILLQVVFHSEIASSNNTFSIEEVIQGISEKMIRRHPHVFGEVDAKDSTQVLKNWEQIKMKEKGDERKSILESVPNHLPALQKAQRVQSRAARVGFEWRKDQVHEVIAKIREELDEFEEALNQEDEKAMEMEMGDVFFSLVNLCRYQKIDSEEALRGTINKFMKRFAYIEESLKSEGIALPEAGLDRMEELWQEAKTKAH